MRWHFGKYSSVIVVLVLCAVAYYVIKERGKLVVVRTQSSNYVGTMMDDSNKLAPNKTALTNCSQFNDMFSKVVYNRVAKCGSRSMEAIISSLSVKNGFTFYKSPTNNIKRPTILNLMQEIKLINTMKPPMLYTRHIHFINFVKFGETSPVYINLIRDPIERFSSKYHYLRYNDFNSSLDPDLQQWRPGQKEMNINDCVLSHHFECSTKRMWYIVPYFCGQEHFCIHPSRASLNKAKINFLDNYLVVGILEDFEGTLKVFEKLMPGHFDGAVNAWNEIQVAAMKESKTAEKYAIKRNVRAILKRRMIFEYEFYHFVAQQFKKLKHQLDIK